jgi:hypothetical protein
MKRLNYMRYASFAAVLGLCVLCAPVQAGGLKGRGKVEIKHNIRGWFSNLKKEYNLRDRDCNIPTDNPCVPEPSSLLGGLAAGAGLCGIGLYHRRRNRQ